MVRTRRAKPAPGGQNTQGNIVIGSHLLVRKRQKDLKKKDRKLSDVATVELVRDARLDALGVSLLPKPRTSQRKKQPVHKGPGKKKLGRKIYKSKRRLSATRKVDHEQKEATPEPVVLPPSPRKLRSPMRVVPVVANSLHKEKQVNHPEKHWTGHQMKTRRGKFEALPETRKSPSKEGKSPEKKESILEIKEKTPEKTEKSPEKHQKMSMKRLKKGAMPFMALPGEFPQKQKGNRKNRKPRLGKRVTKRKESKLKLSIPQSRVLFSILSPLFLKAELRLMREDYIEDMAMKLKSEADPKVKPSEESERLNSQPDQVENKAGSGIVVDLSERNGTAMEMDDDCETVRGEYEDVENLGNGAEKNDKKEDAGMELEETQSILHEEVAVEMTVETNEVEVEDEQVDVSDPEYQADETENEADNEAEETDDETFLSPLGSEDEEKSKGDVSMNEEETSKEIVKSLLHGSKQEKVRAELDELDQLDFNEMLTDVSDDVPSIDYGSQIRNDLSAKEKSDGAKKVAPLPELKTSKGN